MTDVGGPVQADTALATPTADLAVEAGVMLDRDLVIDADMLVDLIAGSTGQTRARVRTWVTLPPLAIEEVEELLQPLRWGDLSGNRIVMARLDGTQKPLADDTPTAYQETFTVSPSLHLWPVLVCHRRTLSNQARRRARALEYRLQPPPAPSTGGGLPGGPGVLVDQGSILVRETEGGLVVATTKRVRFPPPFDGPGLALFAETLGYTEAFEGMVTEALARVVDKRRRAHDAAARREQER